MEGYANASEIITGISGLNRMGSGALLVGDWGALELMTKVSKTRLSPLLISNH